MLYKVINAIVPTASAVHSETLKGVYVHVPLQCFSMHSKYPLNPFFGISNSLFWSCETIHSIVWSLVMYHGRVSAGKSYMVDK